MHGGEIRFSRHLAVIPAKAAIRLDLVRGAGMKRDSGLRRDDGVSDYGIKFLAIPKYPFSSGRNQPAGGPAGA